HRDANDLIAAGAHEAQHYGLIWAAARARRGFGDGDVLRGVDLRLFGVHTRLDLGRQIRAREIVQAVREQRGGHAPPATAAHPEQRAVFGAGLLAQQRQRAVRTLLAARLARDRRAQRRELAAGHGRNRRQRRERAGAAADLARVPQALVLGGQRGILP